MIKNISSTLLLLLLGGILLLSGFLNREEKEVKHLVAYKYRSNVNPVQIEKVNQAFRRMQSKIPGVLSLEIGTNYESDLSDAYTNTYMLTFSSEQARASYLLHPEHKKFEKLLSQLDVVEKSFEMAYSPVR